jgi:hypothetical protein
VIRAGESGRDFLEGVVSNRGVKHGSSLQWLNEQQ